MRILQQAEEVRKDVIKHAYRNIEIVFEPGKTVMTAQDKELVAAFIKLQDFELQMQQQADSMYKFSISISKRIEELRVSLEEIRTAHKGCSKMADKLSDATYSSEEVSLEKLMDRQEHINGMIQNFYYDMMEVYGEAKALNEKIENYNPMHEDDMAKLYDEYSEISLAHCQNYEVNSISIVCYDDEYEKFISFRDFRSEKRKDLVESCDKTLMDYKVFNLEYSVVDASWNELLKRCKLLKNVEVLHRGLLGSTLN